MLHKLYKPLLILGIVLTFSALPVFYFTYSASTNLEVDFLDVGQGDAILIKTPAGQNVLIDGGSDSAVIKRLSENLSWWDKTIDLMILTHPHSDHVAGLVEVLKRYPVKKILYTGVIHDSPDYLAWLEAIRDKKIPLIIIDRPQRINLSDNCYFDILYPQKSLLGKAVDNLNNSSIVAKLIYGETNFLFMGDAEVEVENSLVGTQNLAFLQANILKIGHHGSDTSSSQEFLETVFTSPLLSPSEGERAIAVIQVGADNDFGHPNLRILKRLERLGAKTFRTDLDGTIKAWSNGNQITHNP